MVNISLIFKKCLKGEFSLFKTLVFIILTAYPFYLAFIKYQEYPIASIMVTYLFAILVFNKINIKIKIYITILFQAFTLSFTSSLILIVNCFFESNLLFDCLIDTCVNITIFIFILLTSNRFLSDKIKYFLEFTSKGAKIYLVISLYCLAIFSMLVSSLPEAVSFDVLYKILMFTFVAFIIISSFIYPTFVSNNITKNYYKKLNEIANNQIKAQTRYYEKIAQNTLELRRFKHDYKNQMISLQVYLRNKDFKSAEKFVSKSNSFLSSVDGIKTGNYVLDALINDKLEIAKINGIKIEFNGYLKNGIFDDADLCIIFGNSIDNAIEACKNVDVENRIIRVIVKSQNCLINITITNPVVEAPKIKNNHIKSRKEDSINHGFGIYSIETTVDRYNGTMNISCLDDVFTLNISMSV